MSEQIKEEYRVLTVSIKDRKDIYHYKTRDKSIKPNDLVMVDTILGEEVGKVIKSFGEKFNCLRKAALIPEILRAAGDKDLEEFNKKRVSEKEAFNYCRMKIKEREIPIKLVKVAFVTNEKKAIFFFTSEGRIDFRDIVKDLAKKIKMRIEMKQIGIRDETKIIGGLGICGRQLCCKTFLTNIEPITLQMAKKQNLSLNPLKISGQCGRLMCCLSYEDDSGGRVYIEDKDELIGYDEEQDIDVSKKHRK